MKKNVNYIDGDLFEKMEKALGLKTNDNAGFRQLELGNGYHSYVARTKMVGRVDYQWLPPEVEVERDGTTTKVPLPGIRVLGEGERFGRIVAQLDFSVEKKDDIMKAHELMLLAGASLPTWVRPKRQMISSTKASSPPTAEALAELTDEEREKRNEEAKRIRAELIKKVAAEKGVTVSPNANL